MTTVNKSPEQLQREIADLRAQLDEAQETLQAIRHGEVDALVVETAEGDRIYTLQGAEHDYRLLVEQMHEGAASLDPNGRIIYANQCLATMLRQPLEQVIGSRMDEHLAESSRSGFRSLMRRAQHSQVRGEVLLRTSDGTQVPVLLSFSPPQNGVSGHYLVVTDFSDRMRAEQTLASEQFIRRLIDNAPSGVAVVGRDLRYILANPTYQAIAGDPDNSLVGRTIAEAFPAPVARIVQPLVQQTLDTGQPLSFQEYEAPVRGRTWWNVRQIPLRDAAGHTEAVLIIADEVTEQVQARETLRQGEAALRESESRYRLLMQSIPVPLGVVNTNGEGIYFNDSFTQVFGYSQADLPTLEAWWRRAYPDPAYRRRVKENWQAKIQRSAQTRTQTESEELKVTCKDGSVRVVLISNLVIEDRILATFIDITDRKHAEEALRRSEERLRLAHQVARIGSFEFDPQMNRSEWSPELEALHGLPPGGYSGSYEQWAALVHPDDLRAVEQCLGESLDTGEFETEWRIIRPDGMIRWLAGRGQVFKGASGKPLRMVGVNLDITERKRAEAQLRSDAKRLAAILDAQREIAGAQLGSAALGQLVLERMSRLTGADGASLEVSEADEMVYTAATGLAAGFVGLRLKTAGSLSGLCLTSGELQRADDIETDPRVDREACRRIGLRSMIMMPLRYGEHSFGVLKLMSKRAAAFAQDTERTLRLMGEFLSATIARKRAGEALRESEARYHGLFDSIQEMVTLYEVERDKQGRIIERRLRDCNPAFLRAVGAASIDDLRGRTSGEVFSETWSDSHLNAIQEAMDTGETRLQEVYRPESRRHYITTIVPLDANTYLGTGRDITELKAAEETLRQTNEQLEERVAQRAAEVQHRAEQLRALAAQLTEAEQKERQRLAMLLHDGLQQLLVGTKFHVGILRSQLTSPEQREMVKQVDELLDESLDASRSLTVDLSPPILQQGTMAQVLQWLAQWFASKHGFVVKVQADAKAHPQTPEIRTLLFQVVRELLFNAVKHAGVGSACVKLSRNCDGQVEVVVSDAGKGFDPSQPHASKAEGSGLGLFSIHERLDWLGGKFEIQSAPGKGTRATILVPMRLKTTPESLPVAMEIMAPVARSGGNGQAPSRIRLILADDHAVMRDGLIRLLQTQPDMEVVGQAADGQEAVDLSLQLQPDVIIMDVNMPVMDGKEATRQILARLPNVKVIGLSMFAEPDVAEAMKAVGAVDYLAKTSGPDALIAAIRAFTPAAR